MTITKSAGTYNSFSIEALNSPDWQEFSTNFIKTASIKKDTDLNGFDISAAIKENPDHLFVKIFAIKKDEINDNGDCFSGPELKKAASSFVGVPIFCNHQNDDIEKARGKCVHAWYDDKAGGIFIVAMVDKVAYPKLARGIEEGYISGTSMGCFSGDMRVMMGDISYKKINEIQAGDEVLTHTGEVKRVFNLQEHSDKTNDILYNIKIEGLPKVIKCTKEHPFYTLSEQNYCAVTGQKIDTSKNSYSRFKKRTQSGVYQTQEYTCLKETGELDTFDFEWKEAKSLNVRDMVAFPISSVEIEDADATVDTAKLIGYFLAEGSFVNYKGNRVAVEFNFNLKEEKDTIGLETIQLLKNKWNTDPKVYERKDKNTLHIRLYGKDIAKWFYMFCGEYGYNKKINSKCLFWPKEVQSHILGSWINGDGTTRRILRNKSKVFENISATTTSETLHYQMRFIANRLGIYCTTTEVVDRAIRNNKRPYWTLTFGCNESSKLNDVVSEARKIYNDYKDSQFRIAGDYIVMPIKSIDTTFNVDPVFNLEIEDDQSYILEGVAVHNCSVHHSLCSICHNSSAVADDYCDHVQNRKNKKFSGKVQCQYHKSKEKSQDTCPICGSKDAEDKDLVHKDAQIYEHNYGVKFIEDSFVVNPACHSCLVHEIFNVSELNKKVASLRESVIKLGNIPVEEDNCGLSKVAGKKELEYLAEAMSKIEKVAKSMMSQKQYISMEYVSNLVEAMANVQGILDELIEMGYAQLPSPEIIANDVGSDLTEQLPGASMMPPATPPVEQTPLPVGGSGAVQEPIGDIGSVTLPKTSANKEKNQEKKEDFITIFSNFKDRLQTLAMSLDRFIDNKDTDNTKESRMATKNSNVDNNEKVASHDTSVITEKQLGDAEGAGEKWDSAPAVITEKQLDDPTANKNPNVTTSTSPQARLGSYDVITEKQLASISDGYVSRWNDFPDVITEKQWTETSRLVGSVLSESQDNIITEKQLEDFTSHHSFNDWGVITEKQLDSKTGLVKRWASADTKDIVKIAMNAIADTIAFFGKEPSEVIRAASFVNKDTKTFDKAAYLTLINAMPHKSIERVAEKDRYSYFSKIASSTVKTLSTVDALITSASEYLGGYSADDILTAIKVVANSDSGMAQVESLVKEKINNEPKIEKVLDKTAQMENAIKELDRPEDGLYQVHADLKEIGVDPSEEVGKKANFLKALIKVAEKEINDPDVTTALINADIDEEKGVVVATLKDVTKLTEEEKKAFAQVGAWLKNPNAVDDVEAPATEALDYIEPNDTELDAIAGEGVSDDEFSIQDAARERVASSRKTVREQLVKEAQMFGGQGGPGIGAESPGMGGAGAGPGAGASLPQPPAGAEAPLESFEASDLSEGLEDEAGALEPAPPGTRCPVCTSNDVDVIKGEGRCNNCDSRFLIEVVIRIPEYAGLTGDKDDGEETEAPMGLEGEGFEAPIAEEAPPMAPEAPAMPAAASSEVTSKLIKEASISVDRVALVTKIDPKAIKVASKKGIMLGTVSPLTGTTNTLKIANNTFVCLDTGVPYNVEYAVDKKNAKNVYARWSWNPDVTAGCESCNRSRGRFVKALKEHGLSENEFDALNIKDKGNTILAMKDKGLLKAVKTASVKDGSVVGAYKTKLAAIEDKVFPIETCRQKLANRFGLNAIALSGPCEGKPIYDCVCNSLKNAGFYANGLAIKVADIWMEKEASVECVEDFVRLGFELKQASTICTVMKAKYAQMDDMLAEELSDASMEGPEDPDGFEDEGEMEVDFADTDPFGSDSESGETVTIELPIGVVEQIDQALDAAQGDTLGEDGLDMGMPGEGVAVDIDVPGDAAEAIDEVVDDVLDTELSEEDGIEEDGIVEDGIVEDGIVEESDGLPGEIVEVDEAPEEKEMYMTEKNEEKNDKKEGKMCPCVEEVEVEVNTNENEGVMNPEDTDEEVEKEGDEEKRCCASENDTMDNIEKEANQMKPGYVGQSSRINLDLDGVMAVLNKQAKSLEHQNAQDSPDIGKYKDGKPMANENALSEGGPTVPDNAGKAKIGNEEPKAGEKLDVPAGSPPIGGEKDNKELTDGDTRYTGGDQGAGMDGAGHKAASVKERVSNLADRILKATDDIKKVKTTTPKEKKMAPKEPVAKDKDIQPISGDSVIGDEDKFTADDPGKVKSDGGFIGKEKETFKSKPDDPKDQPSFPAGGGKMKTDTNDPEKQEKDKGTVIAKSSQKQIEAATRLAGKMLAAGNISVDDLATKIQELSSYKVATISDLDKSLFATKKGLTTASDGLESPVVISEASSVPRETLKTQLQGMFSLDHKNKQAQEFRL